MATFEDFKSFIVPEAPGCPDPLLDQQLRETIDHFCRVSSIWQEDQDLSVTEGTKEYSITPPSGTQVMSVSQVKPTDSTIESRYIFDSTQDKLIFQVAPSKDATWEIRLVLKPLKTGTALYKDFLLDNWGYAIAEGVLWSLLMMKQQPFFNPELARTHGRQYLSAVTAARIEANKILHGQAALRVKPQPFV